MPIKIPPMAIVTVPNGTTIHCPEFSLSGPITPERKSTINIIKNLTIVEENNELIDMHKELISNTTWNKLPYLNGDMDDWLQQIIAKTTERMNDNEIQSWHNRHSGKIMIILGLSFGILTVIVIFLTWYGKKNNPSKITIALPKLNA